MAWRSWPCDHRRCAAAQAEAVTAEILGFGSRPRLQRSARLALRRVLTASAPLPALLRAHLSEEHARVYGRSQGHRLCRVDASPRLHACRPQTMNVSLLSTEQGVHHVSKRVLMSMEAGARNLINKPQNCSPALPHTHP